MDYDVVIVGGSLAGASAAVSLANSKLRVALVDKAFFPRRKACGEGLSSFGLAQLQRLGLKEAVIKLPHISFSGYRVKSGNLSRVIKSPWKESITIQRALLDTVILERAISAPNVTPFLKHSITKLEPNAVWIGDKKVTASCIVLACGANSRLLRLPFVTESIKGGTRTALTATFCGSFLLPPTQITIIVKPDYEIYCTPLADGRLNISLTKEEDNSVDLLKLISSHAFQKEVFTECGFAGALELSPIGRAKLGNIRRKSSVPTIILAGDAKEEFDPIGGMGMTHALLSGIEAAEQVQGIVSHRDAETKALRRLTGLSYQVLTASRYFPHLLTVAASGAGSFLLNYFTKELRV